MRLERMSWKDCEEYFKDHDMVILTTGSTENHGIHNPLGTDTMIPNKILELIEKQSDVFKEFLDKEYEKYTQILDVLDCNDSVIGRNIEIRRLRTLNRKARGLNG